MEMRSCSTCGGRRVFEAPACPDGHDRDCPDLACVECGEAVFVGLFSVQRDRPPTAARRVAPAA